MGNSNYENSLRAIVRRTGRCLRLTVVFLSALFYIALRGGRIEKNGIQPQLCEEPQLPPSYKVCNGLANQLLGHAAYISQSIQTQSLVRIPDVFIVNGVQNKVDAKRGLKTVFPNKENSVPLSKIFDTQKLLQFIESHGAQACFVPYEEAVSFHQEYSDECPWLEQLKHSENELSLEVLEKIQPSVSLSRVVENMFDDLINNVRKSNMFPSDGICLHHRNGADWTNHCHLWNGNNCLESEGRSVGDLVHERIPNVYQKKWIYYISDLEPSEKLILEFEGYGLKLIHRDRDQLLRANVPEMLGIDTTKENYKDILATIDFFLCDRIDSFIGNSVSTLSALQIAKRGGKNSSWYNSRSIPLASMLDVYFIPIIYTYTELSQGAGACLLKASILSARRVFGMRADIHVIYHGSSDTNFLNWLESHNVILHNHLPKWRSTIEEMRVSSSKQVQSQSPLFRHSGNYLGTWQRIDIPLFVNSEYALFLDSDTIIDRRFTLADFGPDITRGIALSCDVSETTVLPSNAGVALMNIPKLRKTYDSFVRFIQNHTNTQFIMGPSHQGAYLDFYGNAQHATSQQKFYLNIAAQKDSATLRYLDTKFNFKPYYIQTKNIQDRKITHFHGLNPYDILSFLAGKAASEFPTMIKPLLDVMSEDDYAESICTAMRDFGKAILLEKDHLKTFCDVTIGHDDSHNDIHGFCIHFFAMVVFLPGIDCFSLGHIWKQSSGRRKMNLALIDLEAFMGRYVTLAHNMHSSAPKECECVDCQEDSLCGGLWKGVSYPADASNTHGNPLQSSRRVHIVVSHCKADLHWMSKFTNGFFNVASIHIITKCGQEVVGAPDMATIEKMQNVGRCDHSYARYINSILDTKLSNDNDDGSSSIVMFLKDDRSDQNLHQKARWNDYMTMIQVASSSNGFSCGLVHDKLVESFDYWADISTYHLTNELLDFSLKQYYRRADMYEGDGIEFKSKWINLGAFSRHVLNVNPSSDVVQVCYGGTFAVLVSNIKKVDASVWRAAEKALERGDSIEEGHFMERSWAYLLANPLEQYQIAALLQYSSDDRIKFDQKCSSIKGALFRKMNQNKVALVDGYTQLLI